MALSDPIICAGDRELPDLVDGPDMRDAVSGQARPMTLKIVSLTPDDGGDAKETSRLVQTSGFMLPAEARKLDIKPDGDGTRRWKYWELFVLNDPAFADGDKVEIAGLTYKVVKSWDFSQFGFLKFGVREDFRK